MSFLSRLAGLLKRRGCKSIVRKYGSEYEVNAPDLELGEIKVKAGTYSNHIKQFVKASDLAVNLDNTQILLCEEIMQMKDDEDKEFKDELKKVRLQIILGISKLQTILDTKKAAANTNLDKELKAWLKNIGDLYDYAISLIGPKRRKGIGKGKSAMKIAEIMRYQGIDERQLQKAINEM
jgi:hypothetical protein